MATILNRSDSGITFQVDDVDVVTTPCDTTRPPVALRDRLNTPIEACYDYTGQVIAGLQNHPLLDAVHLAFAQHRPLTLTPDAVWLTIAQGLALHIANDPESCRDKLVAHQGKLSLQVRTTDFADRSPENPWPEVFGEFSKRLEKNVSAELCDLVRCSFSTTGPIERVASDITLMDVLQPFFTYDVVCICGIPTVTLQGTVDDWRDIRERVDRIDALDLGLSWWTQHLAPACEQLAQSAAGDVDVEHWRSIYKPLHSYGEDVTTGWILDFFPYLEDTGTERFSRRNNWLGRRAKEEQHSRIHADGLPLSAFPSGLSKVPVTLSDTTGWQRSVHALAGLIAVTQDPETGAVQPRVGWAIAEPPLIEQLLDRIENEHSLVEPLPTETVTQTIRERFIGMPSAIVAFYKRTNGVNLFGGQLIIMPVEQLTQGIRRDLFDTDDEIIPLATSEEHGTLLLDCWKGRVVTTDGQEIASSFEAFLSQQLGPQPAS